MEHFTPQDPDRRLGQLAEKLEEEAKAHRGKSSRRRVIQLTVLGVAGVGVGVGAPLIINEVIKQKKLPKWRFLTEEEALRLVAMCEQIVPADEQWGGATEAGCVNFIDRQLASRYKRHQDQYRYGLMALHGTCFMLYGKSLEQLPFDQQTKVMEMLEGDRIPEKCRIYWKEVVMADGRKVKPSPRELFRLVRDHTMQGFYGSPRHGGNKEYLSYRMLGLEYPRVIGRNV